VLRNKPISSVYRLDDTSMVTLRHLHLEFLTKLTFNDHDLARQGHQYFHAFRAKILTHVGLGVLLTRQRVSSV